MREANSFGLVFEPKGVDPDEPGATRFPVGPPLG